MARVVVVASTELGRDALGDAVSPEDELYVVVPAVEQSPLDWLTNDEGEARRRAAEVGDAVAEAAPAPVAAVEVKPDVPGQAVRDAIAEHRPDRVLLAVRSDEEAGWLEEGAARELPSQIDGVPVQTVTV
jgi:hypothetical protein